MQVRRKLKNMKSIADMRLVLLKIIWGREFQRGMTWKERGMGGGRKGCQKVEYLKLRIWK